MPKLEGILTLCFCFVLPLPLLFLWVGSPGGAPSWVGVGVALCGPSPAWVGPPWAPWPPPPPAGGAPAWGLRLWGGFFPLPLCLEFTHRSLARAQVAGATLAQVSIFVSKRSACLCCLEKVTATRSFRLELNSPADNQLSRGSGASAQLPLFDLTVRLPQSF